MTRMAAWFANLRIGAKSALAPALAILGLICVAAGAVLVFARLTQDFRSLNETSFVRFAEATNLERSALRVNAELYAIISLAANANETARVATLTAAVLQHIDALTRGATAVAADAGTAGDGKAIVATLAAYAKSARDMLDMAKADAGMALLLMGGVQDDFDKLAGLLGNRVEAADHARAATYQSALASIGQARALLVAAAILATLLAAAATATAIRAISAPIVTLTAAMTRLAAGTTEVAITGCARRDELGAMARALEVFKENTIERARLRREQEAEREARLAHAQIGMDISTPSLPTLRGWWEGRILTRRRKRESRSA